MIEDKSDPIIYPFVDNNGFRYKVIKKYKMPKNEIWKRHRVYYDVRIYGWINTNLILLYSKFYGDDTSDEIVFRNSPLLGAIRKDRIVDHQ